jgi:hypothetical protein
MRGRTRGGTYRQGLRAALVAIALAGAAGAQVVDEKPLPLDGSISADGSEVRLVWADAQPPRVGNVSVFRRELGEMGGQTWRPIAPLHGPSVVFTDDTTRAGIAYEYRVQRTAQAIVDVGYWTTGRDLPAVETRGTAFVVVDETMLEPLADRLARLRLDLLGDGWGVVQHAVPRGRGEDDPAADLRAAGALRAWLQAQVAADPFGRHAVILVGHVPILMTGRAAPDGHGAVPHGSDLFYADMDGQWRATPQGEVVENVVPGSTVELEIGRIDFSNIVGRGEGARAAEIAHLRRYLDKAHNWRHARHGDLREAYGTSRHLVVEQYALRNIVGPDAVTEGGHHDVGEEKPWLLGVDFGDHNGFRYAEHANKAIFTINFGSGKQKINKGGNPMTALLAQPWYPISVGWGGRPAWWLHPMALGRTIGEAHFRTANNGRLEEPYPDGLDYFPTGRYTMRNPVWVNLLGDPTTRPFPLAPPPAFAAVAADGGGVGLEWEPSPAPETLGYTVYRADDGASFRRISGEAPVAGTSFADPDGAPGAVYMLRAYGLKEVYAGSFFTYSQGVFARADTPAEVPLLPAQLETRAGEPLRIALEAPGGPETAPALGPSAPILSFVHGPSREEGDMALDPDGAWSFTPAEGFSGEIELPYTVFAGLAARDGTVTLRVAPAPAPAPASADE